MGLAASQSRMLMLTARKNDIESGMMSISNQKLALSRQSAEASREYSSALNATALTWGNNNLTYGLLMNPNGINNLGQYIITDASNGAVILNDGYINTLGLPTSGNPGALSNIMSQSEFLQTLLGVDEATADDYVNANDHVNTENITVEDNVSNSNFTICYNDAQILNDAGLIGLYNSNTTLQTTDASSGAYNANPAIHSARNKVNAGHVIEEFTDLLNDISSALGNTLENTLLEDLGSEYSDELEAALDYAYSATFNKFVYDSTNNTPGTKPVYRENVGCGNKNQLCYDYSIAKDHGFWGDMTYVTGKVKVDNSQVIDTFLNYFDQYCASAFGGETAPGNTIGGDETTRTGIGGTGAVTAAQPSDTEVVDDGNDVNNNNIADSYEASYYLNLYNAIDTYGWQNNNNVNNEDYLQNQILYDNICIKQMNSKGNWISISTGDADSPLTMEEDKRAIAKAEADYEAFKDELDYKESKLDIEMNDLDTERSAIETELDSVQKIINKNIERTFKMFDA